MLLLCPVATSPPRSAAWKRGARLLRRRNARLGAWTFAASLVAGVLFAALLGLTSTALPVVSGAPGTDAYFGKANACLSAAIPRERLGFALSPEGAAVAVFDGARIARCPREGGEARTLGLAARAVAFDGTAALWIASGDATLKRWNRDGALDTFESLDVLALAGAREGVAVLSRDGRLLLMGSDGTPRAARELSPQPQRVRALLASPDGRHLALIADSGVVAFDADTLAPVRSEAPCAVSGAAWTLAPATLTLLCGEEPSYALRLELTAGARESVPLPEPLPIAALLQARRFVHACDGLPCTSLAD